ncbi:hypothetical protein Hanom_Chr03g00206581 [Helianthus anomalus]
MELDSMRVELELLIRKYQQNELNIKSSDIVRNLCNVQVAYKANEGKGLAYNQVPPLYNHNYSRIPTTEQDLEDEKKNMMYVKPSDYVSWEPFKPKHARTTDFEKPMDFFKTMSVIVEDQSEVDEEPHSNAAVDSNESLYAEHDHYLFNYIKSMLSETDVDKPEPSESSVCKDKISDHKSQPKLVQKTYRVHRQQQELKQADRRQGNEKSKHPRQSHSPRSSTGSNSPKKAHDLKNAFVKHVHNEKCERYTLDCANKAFGKIGEISEHDLKSSQATPTQK